MEIGQRLWEHTSPKWDSHCAKTRYQTEGVIWASEHRADRLVVETLLQRGAIGLVTTHDLALAQIPENMNGSARNFHFEDHLENGKLAFDFKLKPGVVHTSKQ